MLCVCILSLRYYYIPSLLSHQQLLPANSNTRPLYNPIISVTHSSQSRAGQLQTTPYKTYILCTKRGLHYRSKICRCYRVISTVWLGYKMVLSALCAGRSWEILRYTAKLDGGGILQSQPSVLPHSYCMDLSTRIGTSWVAI